MQNFNLIKVVSSCVQKKCWLSSQMTGSVVIVKNSSRPLTVTVTDGWHEHIIIFTTVGGVGYDLCLQTPMVLCESSYLHCHNRLDVRQIQTLTLSSWTPSPATRGLMWTMMFKKVQYHDTPAALWLTGSDLTLQGSLQLALTDPVIYF